MILAALAAAAALVLPDPKLTPGVTRPDLTVAQICATKWGHDHRAVTQAMKAQVFAAYGFSGNADPRCVPDPKAPAQRCEIDHLISRELGGADDVANLWPQPYGGTWNAHDKDRLENRLHLLVCAPEQALPLAAAQAAIRGDWTAAYLKFLGAKPIPQAAP